MFMLHVACAMLHVHAACAEHVQVHVHMRLTLRPERCALTSPLTLNPSTWPSKVEQLASGNWAGNLANYSRLSSSDNSTQMYHAYVFISRYSRAAIQAAVNATAGGYWAYLEVFWPTTCVAAYGTGCRRSTFRSEDVDLELVRDKLCRGRSAW